MATVTLKGNACELCGTEIKVGDKAPQVTVVNANGLADKVVGGAQKKAQLLVIAPSLDTPVCANETRKFNEEAASIHGVDTTVISMDLPFAGNRFCTAEGIANLTVASDFRNKDFAKAYGVLIGDGALAGITCRAIFVIDTEGKVAYKEIVAEITEEPNYEAALEAARKVAGPKTTCCGGGHCS